MASLMPPKSSNKSILIVGGTSGMRRDNFKVPHTKQPLDGGRIGLPADLDEAVLVFLGDGSRFITGQVLSVDGGRSVSEGQIPSFAEEHER